MNSVDAYIFIPILCNQNNLLDQGRKILLKTTSSVRAKRAALHHFSLLWYSALINAQIFLIGAVSLKFTGKAVTLKSTSR